MAKIIKKAWLPFFFTVIVSVTVISGISLILSAEDNKTEVINGNTYVFSLNPSEKETSFTNEKLLTWLEEQTIPFTLYKSNMSGFDKLGFSNENTSIYNTKKNAIYINNWNKEDEIVIDGKRYFYYLENNYEVKGYLNNFTNTISDITVALAQAPTEMVMGTFYLDAGKNSEILLADLLATVQKHDQTGQFNYKKVKNTFSQKILNQSFALLLFIGISVLLFASGFTLILSWMEKYKREMFVRRLSGATETKLLGRIYLNMMLIRLCGIIVGSLLAFIIINIFQILPYETFFHMEAVYSSIILFLFMDLIYTLPMLFIIQKKQLIKIMR